MIYEWLSRVSGDRDNDGIDCESHNNPNGYIPSAPVEPPVEPSTCSADAETWRGLKVCDERPRDGYDRDAFGTSYSSLEGEIIAALPPTMKANGQVYTPYSCLAFDITPDGTAATDIEHIVALAETHDSSIADDRRRDIASDLDNLTIADPTVNRSEKSDRDAADWMPARHGAWFAERVIQVKLEYGLSVDPFLENPAPPSPVHAGDGLVGQEARAPVAAELLHESPALGAQTHRRSFKRMKMLKMLNMPRSNIVGAPLLPVFPVCPARSATGDPRLGDQRAAEAKTGHPPSLDRTRAVSHAMSARHAFTIPHPHWHTLSVWPILAWLPYVDTLVPACRRPRRTPSGSARLHARPPPPARGPWPDP